MGNKGLALLFNILIISLLFIFTGALTHSLFSTLSGVTAYYDHLRAFYLAEGAVEYGKAQLAANPSWNSPGFVISTPAGEIRVKKAPQDPALYGEGTSGRGRVIIKYQGRNKWAII